jgi:hypothetical protein
MTLSNNFKLQVSKETVNALAELFEIADRFKRDGHMAGEPVEHAAHASNDLIR